MPTLTISTANVMGNPLRAKPAVVRRILRAAKAAGPHGVCFGQELAGSNHFRVGGHGDYAHAWRRLMRARGKATFGSPHEVPISVPQDWRVVEHRVIRVHGGKKRVSPARFINLVVVELAPGVRVAFCCCHTVSKPRRGVPSARWRMNRFDEYLGRLGGLVRDLHARGYTVVYGGDMNHRAKGLPKIHPDQRVLIQSGLDHLWYVPAKDHKVTRTAHHKIRRTALMDHPILSATIRIEAR